MYQLDFKKLFYASVSFIDLIVAWLTHVLVFARAWPDLTVVPVRVIVLLERKLMEVS